MPDIRVTTHLTETLATINRYYPATADPPRTAASQIRLAYGSRTPIAADVISVRRDTIDTLTSWARLIAEERDLHPGTEAGDVPALTSFISAHASWLADFDGDHASHELDRIADALEQIAKQSRPSRVKISPCPEVECPGRLVATVRVSDDLLPSTVRCTEDRDHAWEPHDWHALGRRVGPFNPAAVRRLLDSLSVDEPRSYGSGRGA